MYASQRYLGGEAIALFFPDLARRPTQSRHLDYCWDAGANEVYEIA